MLKIFSISILLVSTSVFGKGLDTLKPSEPEPVKAESKTEATEAKPATDPATPAADPATVPATAPAAGAPVVAPGAPAVEAEKKVEPSEMSKRLADKLYLATGIGFLRIPNAKKGEWHANGVADFAVGWKFIGDPASKWSVLGSLRYAPVEVDSVIDGQTYRGVIEGYHLGGTAVYKLNPSFDLLGSVELGYLLVYLSSVDNFEVQSASEDNEIAFTLGFGGDWHVMEKIKFGPRLMLGFGGFQTVQVSAMGSFVF